MSYPSGNVNNPYGHPTSATMHYPAPPGAVPIPFAGAAPPIPSYVNVNPASWQAGVWQPNPFYKPQVASHPQAQLQAWIPGQAWQQHSAYRQQMAQASQQAAQAQAASWNHYKRPKQPSAEYLKNKLLKNPLGLEGMIPAEELEKMGQQQRMPTAPPVQYPEDIQSTPWIWAPRPLDDAQPTYPRSNTQSSAPVRNASEPPPSRPHGSQPSGNQQGNTSFGTTSAQQPQRSQSGPPEAFTTNRQLETTFSSRIIRTPDRNRRSKRSSDGSSSSLGRSGSVDSVVPQMGNMSMGSSSHPTTSSSEPSSSNPWGRPEPRNRHNASSMPPQFSISGVGVYSEEPSSILSPLILEKPSSQPLGRHGSAPVIGQSSSSLLSTIPETREPSRAAYNTDIYSSMPKRNSSQSSKHSSTPPSRGTYSASNSRPSSQQFDNKDAGYSRDSGYSSSTSLPISASAAATAAVRGIVPGPPQGEVFPDRDPAFAHFPRRANPLPPPPREVPVRTSPPRVSRAAPPTGPRIRVGYWNRRGDHLTDSEHVVYAPDGHKYPSELANYPHPETGYMNEKGDIRLFLESRRELPQSLPSRGQPPERPYESFIRYIRNS